MQERSINQQVTVSFNYPVLFTQDAFSIDNHHLANLVSTDGRKSARMLVVIDENVFTHHPHMITQLKCYALAHKIDLVKKPLVVTGGEKIKTQDPVLEHIYQVVADEKIDRHSYILVIGGGAVVDAVGYAAATAHRGIRLIRMPSTVLAQNDAGIGVKNGVNYLGRKNYLGCFTPPYAVINDHNLLSTLSARDKRAGMAEAVKVALIKSPDFFNELYTNRHALAAFEDDAVQSMIYRCAELHLDHIANSGDPFEMGSARPLDFGHWSAHKLEALSEYRIRHGEAVAIGIALDALYSCRQGMISEQQNNQIWQLLLDLGFELTCPELQTLDVTASLEEFREHLGGVLCITLLTHIGAAIEVNQIDSQCMQACADFLSASQAQKIQTP
ncbi:3-dehydroquinate synthase [Algibacillus agarilyticus]|uniref:3-dehydroquinate synthase n=1 Tax=Algibacillus agarilyticus TaxID=2234133 RepID=UPI000DD0DAFC|nr:3-dehydroquinate synthase [Algibacillus agarilyticus]